MGTNAAGLKAKLDSFRENIKLFSFPSVITVQETKYRKCANFKLENYQIFEKVRPGFGGGLLTAINKSLDPVLIQSVNEDIEMLVVQCNIGKENVRVINAYGPQEDDAFNKKILFWQTLEQEINAAKNANCLTLIEMDANAKLGKNVLKQDPHQISENGKLLKYMIERENLVLLNSSELCKGAITRHRVTKIKEEKSIIDYILVCEKLAAFFELMYIDEERIFPLTKYATTKGIKKIVESDHNILYAKFVIQYRNTPWKKEKHEVFNLKNPECQAKFSELTSDSSKLRKCFTGDQPFPEQCNKFFKSLDDILHQSFRKVKIGKPLKNAEIQELIRQKSKFKIFLNKNISQKKKAEVRTKITQIEDQLSNLSSSKNSKIVEEHLKSLEGNGGKFSQTGMWRLKSRLWPKPKDAPMAKYDGKGNLVASPLALKQLYIEHYKQRLAHREIRTDYRENYEKKVRLWKLRSDRLKVKVTADWSVQELRTAIKLLKNNKSRDPSGLLNELFKYPVIGRDLETAILKLINGIKSENFIPPPLQMSNITTIYKSSGSRHDLESDRGIFSLSVYRKIIDKLIYQEKYPLIDQNMSYSNIGARKKRNIKNHLFIIYAVINSVIKSESCVDIQIYDLVKAFDVLWLQDTMNDLWDTLPERSRDDRLGLIYQLSKENLVAVNTAVGQTDRVTIPEFTAQGGTWGPMLCSNTIDSVGKVSEQFGQFYLYKNIARIIPLAMIDDLIAVRSCGFDAIETNITINTIIELKKLQFHIPGDNKKSKCHFLHIGKKNKNCPGMKVHGVRTGRVTEAVYLGDIIRKDGKNNSNIKDRVRKGLGIVTNIMNILETITFGSKYFEIAVTMRQALLINGILTNSEVWHGTTKAQFEELEEVDKLLIRRILNAPIYACIESLYLELGLTPIHIIIKGRRIKYLHYLLRLSESEMLFKVFQAQWNHPVKDDWTITVQQDLKDFKINLSLEEIKGKTEWSFKRLVKKKSNEYALDYLLKMKQKHSKMDNLQYEELKIQNYLKDENITVKEAQNLFKYRTKVARFKENFKNMYEEKGCPFCLIQPDTQSHCVQCPIIKESINIKGDYSDIFSEDIPKEISQTLLDITKFRENILSPVGGPSASDDAANRCRDNMHLFELG